MECLALFSVYLVLNWVSDLMTLPLHFMRCINSLPNFSCILLQLPSERFMVIQFKLPQGTQDGKKIV